MAASSRIRPRRCARVAQHSARAASSNGGNKIRAFWDKRERRSGNARSKRSGIARRIKQIQSRAARAVVEIEQRDLVVAMAGDGLQPVERDHIVAFQRIQRLAQASAAAISGR